MVSHIGYLQVNGIPFSGAGQFKVALVQPSPVEATLWSNDGTSTVGDEPLGWIITNLVHGRYSIPLGDVALAGMTAPIPVSAVSVPGVVLRVWFNNGVHGFQRLAPDQPLHSVPYALLAASVQEGAIGPAQLAPNSITTTHILNGTILAEDIADGAITSAKIFDGAVLSADIANGAVLEADLANNAVTSAKILNATILSEDIADGAVANIDIANNAVTSAKILDATITGADIADGTLGLSDLNLPSVDVRYVLKTGDTMTGDLTVPKLIGTTIASSNITNLAGILSVRSRSDIEMYLDQGGGALSFFEIFNGAGNHLFHIAETGFARLYGDTAVDGRFGVGTTTFDNNAIAQINFPTSDSVPHLRLKSGLGSHGFGIQFVNPDENWFVGPNIGNWPDDRFNILADSSNKGLIISTAGNVRIGSVSDSTPFTTLTVDGTIGFPNIGDPAMYAYPSGTSNPQKALIVHSPAFPEWGLYYVDDGDRFAMKSSADDSTPSLVVDLGDNWVAIATDTRKPGYELSVNGQIVCEELLVEDSANWPDYVFQDDYQLQSLEEVEAHIRDKKHLPGIPTAADIAKNGLPIGEIQKKMMEKIEELTLHLIEQNKRMSAQDERIRQLESQLARQEDAK